MSSDFDFLFGTWRVRNRRLCVPLCGGTEWYEFDAHVSESPLLGGRGNLEQYDAPETPRGPIHAIAVRLYDEATGRWSIFWSTAGSGTFLVPTVGTFDGGVGRFFAREEYDGRPIVVRFIWTPRGGDACRWEQAFSADDGATWETNWTMEFTRAAADLNGGPPAFVSRIGRANASDESRLDHHRRLARRDVSSGDIPRETRGP